MAKEPTKPRIVIFDLDDTLIHEGFEDYAHLGEMLLFKEVKSVLEYAMAILWRLHPTTSKRNSY